MREITVAAPSQYKSSYVRQRQYCYVNISFKRQLANQDFCSMSARSKPRIEGSRFDLFHKVFDASRNHDVCLSSVIPVTDRSIAMPEEEIAIQIRPNDANFFAAPPVSLKRPPIGITNKARNSDHPVAVPKRWLRLPAAS